jgi:hypothetical protein
LDRPAAESFEPIEPRREIPERTLQRVEASAERVEGTPQGAEREPDEKPAARLDDGAQHTGPDGEDQRGVEGGHAIRS